MNSQLLINFNPSKIYHLDDNFYETKLSRFYDAKIECIEKYDISSWDDKTHRYRIRVLNPDNTEICIIGSKDLSSVGLLEIKDQEDYTDED